MNKLTNVEIVETLLDIRNTQNACDRAEKLKIFESTYKKTPFYKRTKKPLLQLYYEVSIEDILTFKSLLQNLQNFINGLDAEHFLALMDQINEMYAKTLEDNKVSFDQLGLADLFKNPKRN